MVRFEIFLDGNTPELKEDLGTEKYDSWLKIKNAMPDGVYLDFTGTMTGAEIEVERATMKIQSFPLAYRPPGSEGNYKQVGTVRVIHE